MTYDHIIHLRPKRLCEIHTISTPPTKRRPIYSIAVRVRCIPESNITSHEELKVLRW
jgi:hypothetical protein